MKENDRKLISASLAYIPLIRLPLCMSTGERERERQRERIFVKTQKKKKKKKIKIGHKPFYSQVNDKE